MVGMVVLQPLGRKDERTEEDKAATLLKRQTHLLLLLQGIVAVSAFA